MERVRSAELCELSSLSFVTNAEQLQVLGEIGTPRKKMPRGTAIGVFIVITLYLLVNVAYVSTRTNNLEFEAANTNAFPQDGGRPEGRSAQSQE